jgi:membrane-associated phospholipid phosphatase
MPMKQTLRERAFLASLWRLLNAHSAASAMLFLGVLLPLTVFAKIADEVHDRKPFGFDDPLLLDIHRHASPLFDRAMLLASAFGSPGLMVLLCSAVIALLLVRKRRHDAAFFALAVVGAGLLNLGAKLFFGRARPDLWISIAPRDDFSFPSGHAMGTMAVACAIYFLARSLRLRVLALLGGGAFVLTVGFSRMYLGVHYPSDVLGGWLASLAWVCGLHFIYTRRSALENKLFARKR